MANQPDEKERLARHIQQAKGRTTFDWNLTDSRLTGIVKLQVPPSQVIPIIFVPGIMGSNLCDSTNGNPVWLLDGEGLPVELAKFWVTKLAGARQRILHPDRTRVYKYGAVPNAPVGALKDERDFHARGWGEVAQTSYHEFLVWLENKLNGEGYDPLRWSDFSPNSFMSATERAEPWSAQKLRPGVAMKMVGLPGVAEPGFPTAPILSDDLLQRSKCRFPVYAFGYNWLASNKLAAIALKDRIEGIIRIHNGRDSSCKQVILVTHSMGGLVARACCRLPEMEKKVVGVVHGVMPAVGAAVAYRRCKIGMRDEDLGAGLVIGLTGTGVTAVFAQAPGALQLLPSKDYGIGWLTLRNEQGQQVATLPQSDPYDEIYLNKKNWWGLVREEWLSPRDGISIKWNQFVKNIQLAKDFHEKLADSYHPNTYVFYGAGSANGSKQFNSFGKIHWRMRKGVKPAKGDCPTAQETFELTHGQVREDGKNLIYVGGESVVTPNAGMGGVYSTIETSFWELTCEKHDTYGDGTVPENSGAAPRRASAKSIKQQFKLTGFDHEPAYKDAVARQVTYYSITKLAREAIIG